MAIGSKPCKELPLSMILRVLSNYGATCVACNSSRIQTRSFGDRPCQGHTWQPRPTHANLKAPTLCSTRRRFGGVTTNRSAYSLLCWSHTTKSALQTTWLCGDGHMTQFASSIASTPRLCNTFSMSDPSPRRSRTRSFRLPTSRYPPQYIYGKQRL